MSLAGTLVLCMALLGVAYGEETTNENDSPLYHVRTVQSMEQRADVSLKTIKSEPLEFDEYKEACVTDSSPTPQYISMIIVDCTLICFTVATCYTCHNPTCWGQTCGCTCAGTCTATCGASCMQSGYALC